MNNERLFFGMNKARDIHTSLAAQLRQWDRRDWILSMAVMAFLGVTLTTSAVGFVSASNFSDHEKPKVPCQPSINVALQRSLGPRLSVLETYSEMGVPMQLYLRSGNDFQNAVNDERKMRNLYNADILMNYIDPKFSFEEGDFVRDFSQKCRMVLYYP
jgi:hypothetical protein